MEETQLEEPTTSEIAERLRMASDERNVAVIDELASHHPRALAEAVYRLPDEDVQALARLIGSGRLAEIVAELDAAAAAEVLTRLSPPVAADVLEEMAPDDATDVIDELPPAQVEGLLTEMTPAEAEDVRDLLVYPPDTAGGLMTPEYVAVRPHLTVEQAIAEIRRLAADAETIYYVYVVDDEHHLLGVLSLRNLLLARPGQTVANVMNTDVRRVTVDTDQEELARTFQEHNFLALPVVDAENRLLGIITADDVADVIQEETTEDIERLGGSEPLEEPYLHASVVDVARKRVGWLLLLFVAGAYTATVMRYFADELQQVVALTFFVPLLIGTGGNVGSQTVMTIIRAMAVGEVKLGDVLRVLGKEARVGVLVGGLMALASYARAWMLGVGPNVGLAVAIATASIVLWAATVAAILPLALRRLGIDPAVVSAPFISTLVDGTGLLIYFTVARVVLGL